MFRLYEETRHAPPPPWSTAVDGLGVPEEIWSALHRKAQVVDLPSERPSEEPKAQSDAAAWGMSI